MEAGQVIMTSAVPASSPVQNMSAAGGSNGFGSLLGEVLQQSASLTDGSPAPSSKQIVLPKLQATLTETPLLVTNGDQETLQDFENLASAQLLAGFLQTAMMAPAMQPAAVQAVEGAAIETSEVTQVNGLPSAMPPMITAAELQDSGAELAKASPVEMSISDILEQSAKQKLITDKANEYAAGKSDDLHKSESTDNALEVANLTDKKNVSTESAADLKAAQKIMSDSVLSRQEQLELASSNKPAISINSSAQEAYGDSVSQSARKSTDQDSVSILSTPVGQSGKVSELQAFQYNVTSKQAPVLQLAATTPDTKVCQVLDASDQLIAQKVTQQQAPNNAESLLAGAAAVNEQLLSIEAPATSKAPTQAATTIQLAQAPHVVTSAMQPDQQMQQDNTAFTGGRGGLAKPEMVSITATPENVVENVIVDVDTVMPASLHNLNNQAQQHSTVSSEIQIASDAAKINPDQLFKQVADRISDQGLKQGNNQVTLKLSPEHLGNLQMNLTMADQQLRVEIVAENRAVRDVLMQKIDELKESLAQQNIQMESFDVSTGTNGGLSQQSANWRQAATERRYQELRYTGVSRATVPQMVDGAASVQYVAQQYQSTIDMRF